MSSAGPPILVQGILQRSGTNYLWGLIREHPDTAVPEPIWEDFLLAPSGSLADYAEAVYRKWDPAWGISDEDRRELLAAVGSGALRFLIDHIPPGRRLLTKTPSVQGLPLIFDLFPSVRLLILVRDGRAVVESGKRTFGWNYERATRAWARAADVILDFDQPHSSSFGHYRIVRFESLHTDPVTEMRQILDFLELDPTKYDFDNVTDFPVRGSSVHRGGLDEVHWKGVPKTPDDDPTRRWHHWTPKQHERFNWLAGRQLEAFGYEPVGGTSPSPIRHRSRDLAWSTRSRVRWLRSGIRRLRRDRRPTI